MLPLLSRNSVILIIPESKGFFNFFFKLPKHWKDKILKSALSTRLLHPHPTCQQDSAVLLRKKKYQVTSTKLGIRMSVI